MSLPNLLASLRADPAFMSNVATWRTLRAQPARYVPIPPSLHPALQASLQQRDLTQLYTHQSQAVEAAQAGQNLVIATPTASGKTLCYNLPVFDALLRDAKATALYLFPTKALAHDQLDEIRDWRLEIGDQANSLISTLFFTYDGDTPSPDRTRIRKTARVLLSNPDMLHTGLLPYHPQWARFWAGLRYVVIDEVHVYRGVFGSQVANVLRRLQRLCKHYGARPQFICTSATIANPGALVERLIEQPVIVLQESGAPRGEKHILLYNPPMYDAEKGLRRNSVLESTEIAARCVLGGLQTILFGRSRQTTELLLMYLKDKLGQASQQSAVSSHESRVTSLHSPISSLSIRGYRGKLYYY